MRKISIALVAAACLAALPAFSQSYPNQTIKMVVPFAAGGPADALARIFAERFSAEVGRPVVIENRLGQASQ